MRIRRLVLVLMVALLGGVFYYAGEMLRSSHLEAAVIPLGLPLESGRLVPAAEGAAAGLLPSAVHEVKIENVYRAGSGLMVMLELSNGSVGGNRYLPIFVGTSEALAIARGMAGVQAPRPMTHDLLQRVIASLDGRVERVTITRIDSGTFYAMITFQHGKHRIHMDARPSDGMALALRTKAKIFVADAVMGKAGRPSVKIEDKDGDEHPAEQAEEAPPEDPVEKRLWLQDRGFL